MGLGWPTAAASHNLPRGQMRDDSFLHPFFLAFRGEAKNRSNGGNRLAAWFIYYARVRERALLCSAGRCNTGCVKDAHYVSGTGGPVSRKSALASIFSLPGGHET